MHFMNESRLPRVQFPFYDRRYSSKRSYGVELNARKKFVADIAKLKGRCARISVVQKLRGEIRNATNYIINFGYQRVWK